MANGCGEKEKFMPEITTTNGPDNEDGEPSYIILQLDGDIDAYSVSGFREALSELAEAKGLIVNLSGVPFMDSAGLGALIGGIRRARDNGGVVVVACDNPALIRLLQTTGFDRIVPVLESLDDAIENLQAGGTIPE